MQTQDVDLLFRADADVARAEARRAKASRTSHLGSPIAVGSRPLDLLLHGNDAWVSCSGFVVKCFDLNSSKCTKTLRGHTGPVTCLALHRAGARNVLISGSWDKSIRFWDAQTGQAIAALANAHADFVKVLLVIPELQVLVSGGSDKDVRIVDLASLSQPNTPSPPTFPFLASLRDHTRPVECLEYQKNSQGQIVLCSADTMGKAVLWQLSKPDQLDAKKLVEWREHETAVYDLVLEPKGIWTASADHTALFSAFDFDDLSSTPDPTLRVTHPYYVKSILPLQALAPDLEEPFLISGSSDEALRVYDMVEVARQKKPAQRDVQVWDVASTSQAKEQALVKTVDAFAHEVNRLALWTEIQPDGLSTKVHVISTSLDETLRRWPLSELLDPDHTFEPPPEPVQEKTFSLSQEEEDELAALMDD